MKTDIEFIKAQLRRRSEERQLKNVAAGSGVGLRTLHRVIKLGDCRLATAEALQDYLSRNIRRRRLDDAGQ